LDILKPKWLKIENHQQLSQPMTFDWDGSKIGMDDMANP